MHELRSHGTVGSAAARGGRRVGVSPPTDTGDQEGTTGIKNAITDRDLERLELVSASNGLLDKEERLKIQEKVKTILEKINSHL